jgi:hypothetical protein
VACLPQGHPYRRYRLPAAGITYAVVVVKRGTRTCPLGVRRQERVAAQLSTAPLRGPNSTQQRTESSEHLPPDRSVRFKGLITHRGEQGTRGGAMGDRPIRPLFGEDRAAKRVRDRTRPPSLRTRLGPRLVHTPSEPSGPQRSPAVHRSPRS